MSKLTIFFLLAAAFLLSFCQTKTAEKTTAISEEMTNQQPTPMELTLTNSITQAEIDEGWQLLFDGRSTKHWKGYTKSTFPENGWKVENGGAVGYGKWKRRRYYYQRKVRKF